MRRPDRSEIASATPGTAGSCPGTRHPIPPRLLPSHNHGPFARRPPIFVRLLAILILILILILWDGIHHYPTNSDRHSR